MKISETLRSGLFKIIIFVIVSFNCKAQEHMPVPEKERINEIAKLLSPKPLGIGHPISERDFWNGLSNTEQASRVIQQATKLLLAKPLPVNKETYMSYIEGNTERQNYDTPFREQNMRLCTFVLAEALENDGRFMPAIESLLRDMLSLGTWTKPQQSGGTMDVW